MTCARLYAPLAIGIGEIGAFLKQKNAKFCQEAIKTLTLIDFFLMGNIEFITGRLKEVL